MREHAKSQESVPKAKKVCKRLGSTDLEILIILTFAITFKQLPPLINNHHKFCVDNRIFYKCFLPIYMLSRSHVLYKFWSKLL